MRSRTMKNHWLLAGIAGVIGWGCSFDDPTGTHGTAGAHGTPGPSGSAGRPTQHEEAGAPVTVPESEARKEERASIQSALSVVSELDDTDLLARHSPPFQPAPTYELAGVAGLATIQSSPWTLTQPELEKLLTQGFVISGSRTVPSFLYGYAGIYAADLPVYVSADSILYALHDSFDEILKSLEMNLLVGELQALLSGARARLKSVPQGTASDATRADVDVYLSVAESLLLGRLSPPTSGGDAMLVSSLFSKATAGSGAARIELFGVLRDEDFSQFTPRGHYAGTPALERYFRSTIWLGRTDFRLIETLSDGSQVFRRRQLEAALLIRELIDASLRPHFDRIDATVSAFVGEHDYMQLSELDSLLADLSVRSLAELTDLTDERIVGAISAGGYGAQRISSHIMYNGMDEVGTLPLSASFALLGQRYVLDSHVFSNVVYDRAGGGSVKRMMPDPLDAAFAALGNDQAASLLAPELQRYAYASDLASMRVLADAHPQDFWNANLYNLWLSTLRTLSPNAEDLSQPDSGLFPAARSEAWGRRLLSTQLASWAELRHDTILYAKQSYTGGISCEFPDAYVDPYPEFYAKVGEYAARGKDLIAGLGLPTNALPSGLIGYFDNLSLVAARLREMAEHQRTGAAFTPAMLDFINDAVTVESICGGDFLTNLGWYGRLFYDASAALEFDPTIADVHTQPTDEAGNVVGHVLHVGTGAPRAMVVIAENCSGPRAYVGLASSYYEQITNNFERLTDMVWKTEVVQTPPADPEWLAPIITR